MFRAENDEFSLNSGAPIERENVDFTWGLSIFWSPNVACVPKASGEPCNQEFEFKSTTTLSYYLTNVHGIERGAPAHAQKKIKCDAPTGPKLTEKQLFCATWATNGLAYELVDESLFRRTFGPSIPIGMNRSGKQPPSLLQSTLPLSGLSYQGKWLTLRAVCGPNL